MMIELARGETPRRLGVLTLERVKGIGRYHSWSRASV